jgi:acetyl-CoA carboxylase biotin carboxyl carrier protein
VGYRRAARCTGLICQPCKIVLRCFPIIGVESDPALRLQRGPAPGYLGAIVGKVSVEDLEAFVRLFDASDWDRVEVEVEDFALVLAKSSQPGQQIPALLAQPPAHRAASNQKTSDEELPSEKPLPARTPAAANVPEGCLAIRAPHLGTFYLSPKPGAAPYVKPGQSVNADTEICLLEVMKLFTTLRAGMSGVIRAICAKDSALVESGDVLFWVEPNS